MNKVTIMKNADENRWASALALIAPAGVLDS